MEELKRSGKTLRDTRRLMSGRYKNPTEAFADIVQRFIAAEKEIPSRLKWRDGEKHPDYSVAVLRIACPEFARFKARIVLTSHIYFDPRKYTFALLLGRERVLALDVGPRRAHKNLFNKSVSCTHWHYYPSDQAIPDDRVLSHYVWLDLFFKKCNVIYEKGYAQPMHDKEQMSLAL
jgi:hypothetical protein